MSTCRTIFASLIPTDLGSIEVILLDNDRMASMIECSVGSLLLPRSFEETTSSSGTGANEC